MMGSNLSARAIGQLCFLHGCSVLLVILFVNTYGLYRLLRENGWDILLRIGPFLVATLVLIGVFWCTTQKSGDAPQGRHRGWLLSGLLLCLLALAIPDPAIPVKRIHVAEYLLLSLLVRYTLARQVQGCALLIFSATLTSILGIHDEFLQGMHPLRTYGIRDMTVNILGGTGGSLLWHGMSIFGSDHDPVWGSEATGWNPAHNALLVWLAFSIPALAGPIHFFLNTHIPLWVLAPLAGSVGFLLLPPSKAKPQGQKWIRWLSPMRVIHFFALCLCFYPLLVNWLKIPFY